MKRKDLLRHLERRGCEFVREGKEHSLYIHRQTKKSAAVPRHREIPQGTQFAAFVARLVSRHHSIFQTI